MPNAGRPESNPLLLTAILLQAICCGQVFIIPGTTLMTLFYPFTKLLLVLLWYSLCKSTEYSSRNISSVEDRKELLLSFTWHYYYIVVGCSISGRFSFRQIWCHIDLSLTEQCSQSVFFSASAFFTRQPARQKVIISCYWWSHDVLCHIFCRSPSAAVILRQCPDCNQNTILQTIKLFLNKVSLSLLNDCISQVARSTPVTIF